MQERRIYLVDEDDDVIEFNREDDTLVITVNQDRPNAVEVTLVLPQYVMASLIIEARKVKDHGRTVTRKQGELA